MPTGIIYDRMVEIVCARPSLKHEKQKSWTRVDGPHVVGKRYLSFTNVDVNDIHLHYYRVSNELFVPLEEAERIAKHFAKVEWRLLPQGTHSSKVEAAVEEALDALVDLSKGWDIGTIRVKQSVLEQGAMHAQISFRGMPTGDKETLRKVTLDVVGVMYPLVIGDTGSIWRCHQESDTSAAFENLYAMLSKQPDKWVSATVILPGSRRPPRPGGRER